jgi:molybdate transport system substrate-binding protein
VAASAQEVWQAVAAAYEREHPEVKIQVNAGASNQLAAQIVQGAPVDLFLSASRTWAHDIPHEMQADLFSNQLVLVVPRENRAQIATPADLLQPAVKHIALAGEQVPVGMYAEQALTRLQLYARLVQEQKIVRGQDARNTLRFVERGEADAGIVYATDAFANPAIKVVHTFAPELHDEITYVLLLLPTKSDAAKEFYAYLQSNAAQALYAEHGFVRVPQTQD